MRHNGTYEQLSLVVIRCNAACRWSCSDMMVISVGHNEVVVNSFGSQVGS